MTDNAPVLSASQLELWKMCPRRWFFTYIEGRREPPNLAAQCGTYIHKILETHDTTGNPIDQDEVWNDYPVGAIAFAMSKDLPTAHSFEQNFTLEVDGIKLRGVIDRLGDNSATDHKSTSNLKYAKSAEELSDDIQALTYARYIDKDVDLYWNYGQTKGKVVTRRVHIKMLRDEVRQKFEKVVTPVAKQVLAAYKHRDKKRTRQNTEACFKFPPLGCPFKADCVEKKIMGSSKMMEMLKANKVAPEAAAAVAADMKAIAYAQAEHVDPINPPNVVRTPAPAAPAVVDTLPKKPRKKREGLAEISKIGQEAEREQTHEDYGLAAPLHSNVVTKAVEQAATDSATLATRGSGYADVLQSAEHSTKPIRTLFVNCLPLGKQAIYAYDLIAKAAQTVENDLEIHHVKLAPFGAGGPSLAAQVRADILASGETFDLVLSTRSPEGRDCEQVLLSLAQNVVMGL